MRDSDGSVSDRMSDEGVQRKAFEFEHAAAYLIALAALALGAVGLLTGFGLIGEATGETASDVPLASQPQFLNSLVWLLPAIALGLLSSALHRADHHRSKRPNRLPDREESMFNAEHSLAYVMALLTVVGAVLALLVGFDVLDRGNDQADGIVWGFWSVLYGIITTTLHAVRHHQMVADEDYIVERVEERVRGDRVRAAGTGAGD